MSQDRTYVRKRRVPRRAFHRRIGILAGGKYFTTDAHEIGEGGILFISEAILNEGQQIVVTFNIPGVDYVVARSVVRYIKKTANQKILSYGVQFETLDFGTKRKIRAYVAQKSSAELNVA